ncbi:hypothetical protein L21SP3_00157 [Sedimentisphaera cyanobacteriorum]|uniref:Ice-binding protein C-terminal domain-containing protein n=1 Tax=Sedimentisphaera cyanobacteriorum TaxID=1940790 RepID=A0A1Q2HM79_9BACT|nr:PEP-CTERM sorting domain-containing protein [Sedimentisphaera cyanobacteriorum]AQQ08381.1 hypothetical protein L21SP3_00157 [Sedimentisphaera cyanobacteriorum]
MKKSVLFAIFLVFAAGAAKAAFNAVGVYDEQDVQSNQVDYDMGYSSNSSWTTGIGQTLGDNQILTLQEFKPMVEQAFTNGRGGVVDFEHQGTIDDASSFDVKFDGGNKQFTVTATGNSGAAGTFKFDETGGDRTPISGADRLQGNSQSLDFDFSDYIGMESDERIKAIGWTILGRSNSSGSANWRVIARYTNGTDTGSSSTFRTINMSSGDTTHDSFSGIAAPDGYWITGMRINSDQGAWSAHDDFGFVTVPEPATLAIFGLGGCIVSLNKRKRRNGR